MYLICRTNLSLLEDDEGARFAGAGFGFRACGFGAGFSANGKKNKQKTHFIQKKNATLPQFTFQSGTVLCIKRPNSHLSCVPVVLYEEVDRTPIQTWSQIGTQSRTELDEASRPLSHCPLLFSRTLTRSLNLSQTKPSALQHTKQDLRNEEEIEIFNMAYSIIKLIDHLLLPSPSCFLCSSPSRFLLWCKILLEQLFSVG